MGELNFKAEDLQKLFKEVGLYSPKGEFYTERMRKHQQIMAYITQFQAAFNKLSTKRPIVLLDCGCGKSYLSFVLYEYCRVVLNREVKIFGVDRNAELIDKCTAAARELNFTNMQFYSSDVSTFKADDKIDIVYSLHACDTATDQTIAKGITTNAKYIFSVSCCQHTNRKRMSGHPLHSVSRHQAYKERLTDMLGDSMRALLMEHFGYGVKVFEFVAAEYTPKNIMVRGVRDAVKIRDREQALKNYRELVEMFHFAPLLEEYVRNMNDPI